MFNLKASGYSRPEIVLVGWNDEPDIGSGVYSRNVYGGVVVTDPCVCRLVFVKGGYTRNLGQDQRAQLLQWHKSGR